MVDDLATALQRSKIDHSLLEIRVNGLAENRPSVMKGDLVDVILPNTPKRVYKGEVCHIADENVHLALDPSFHRVYTVGTNVEVRFNLRRSALRCFHHGLDCTSALPGAMSLLFPEPGRPAAWSTLLTAPPTAATSLGAC